MLSRVSSPSDTPRGLSRRLTRYGDEGFARFLREAFLESTGLSREAFDRPVIGIASTASDFNPCHATAPELISAIQRGVTMAGGLPFTFPTISLHESFAYPSSLILRTLLFGPRYPSRQRLERRGWVAADWGTSENNRRARYYRLTRAGKRRLTEALARVMRPREEEG